MKLRRGKYGEFYGCTGYPVCKATMSKRDAALEEILPEEERTSWKD
jgi:ssDNA-binding Zn-finger/Zn-ribbon topoisomerase 1